VLSNSPVSAAAVPDRVVVVGASAGSLATAEALRRLGYGGHVTIVGNEPHLPYDRPPLSKQILTGELDPVIAAYRSGDRVAGIVAVGMPPKALRAWRAAIAGRQSWSAAAGGALASA
jgi:NADPH-dependent 2,4-dienoyl-CoA reductase/sulfur reductase-like enzyme